MTCKMCGAAVHTHYDMKVIWEGRNDNSRGGMTECDLHSCPPLPSDKGGNDT